MTLVEVMVTVVVVGVALTVICQGFSWGTRTASVAQQSTTAALLAEDLLARMETGEVDFLTETEGTFEDDWVENDPTVVDSRGFQWRSEVEDGGKENLYLLTLTVYWDDTFTEETTHRFDVVRYMYHVEEEEEEEEAGGAGGGQ
jgi:type II secretory pathway pseudopilin PulG